MLDLVEARSALGALLALPLQDTAGGLIVREIEGLDPVKATLVSSSFAQLDGEYYQSSRRETRNIRIRLGLLPDYVNDTVKGLRDRLYKFFMPKSEVNLRFYMADEPEVDISGRVESFETVLFSKDPEVVISVMCFDPDFKDLDVTTMNGNTTATTDETLHVYAGTVETGVLFRLLVNRDVSAFSIYHRGPDGVIRTMDFSNPLVAGDVLEISTVAGEKRVTRIRSGVQTSVLYGLSPQSAWMELLPGDNFIRFYAVGAAIPFTMSYNAKFGGL